MKKLGKILSLLIAALMLFSLAVPVFAAGRDDAIIVIKSPYKDHTYAAYQVFGGDYDTVTKGLKRIVWGEGVDGDALLNALKGIEEGVLYVPEEVNDEGETIPAHSIFADCENAADVATVLQGFENNSEQIDAFADIVNKHLTEEYIAVSVYYFDEYRSEYEYSFYNAPVGYYLVKDITEDDGNTPYPKYMLKVVEGSAEINVKSDAPYLEKYTYRPAKDGETATHYKLKDGRVTIFRPYESDFGPELYENPDEPTYVRANAGYSNVGDIVSFEVEIPIPKMDGYEQYTYTVIDEMSKGLSFTYSVDAIYGYVSSYPYGFTEEVNIKLVQLQDYETVEDYKDDTKTLVYTVETEEISEEEGTRLTINFPDIIKCKELYKDGTLVDRLDEKLVIRVQYSAIVNKYALSDGGAITNSAKLEYSRSPYDPDVKGKTPESETYTYTAGILIRKIDQDGKKLTGAKFGISGSYRNIFLINGVIYVKDNDNGTYYRLKDGTYTEEEPNSDTIDSYESEDKYREVALALTVDKDSPDLGPMDYETCLPELIVQLYDQEYVAEAWVDNNGSVLFGGLGAGEYTITELVAPDGYNSLKDPIKLAIEWEEPETPGGACKWYYSINGGERKEFAGIIDLDVVNHTGATLPSTGGIGTTIFYVLGAVLAVGAVVVLATRKRMSEDNAR